MTDTELLEAAARAAGIPVLSHLQDEHVAGLRIFGGYWNPLQDDGAALRLAVKLYLWKAIQLAHRDVSNTVDIYAATRRAIVCAAAAMAPKEAT